MIQDYIIIRNQSIIERFFLCDIVYIEIDGSLLTINTIENRKFNCTMTLKAISAKLPEYFLRINKNRVINTLKMKSYHRKRFLVTLTDDSVHRVSQRRVSALFKTLTS